MTNKSNNPLIDRVRSLVDLSREQVDKSLTAINEGISDDELRSIKRIFFTGCGDSFMAGKAATHVFQEYADNPEHIYEAVAPLELARFEYIPENLNPSETLVIGISASGSPVRVQEAMLRAKHYGMKTMAVTNNPDSKVASAADYILVSNDPEKLNDSPGLRSYLASMITLYLLGVKYGSLLKTSDNVENFISEIRNYMNSYTDYLDEIIEVTEKLAENTLDAKAFTFIGDGIESSTASFSAAKVVEVAGKITIVNDSEEWCHINYFNKFTEDNPVFVIANSASKNLTRISETLNQADVVGHPTILVIDDFSVESKDLAIPENTQIINLPMSQNILVQALGSYIPGTLFAAHLAEKTDEPYFRGDKFPMDAMTTSNSKITYPEK